MTNQRHIVEQSIKAFNAGDFAQMFSHYADDFVMWSVDGERTGLEANEAAMEKVKRQFPDGRVDITAIYEDGSAVIVQSVFQGTNQGPLDTPLGDIEPTGRKVSVKLVDVFQFDGDQIVHQETYTDQMEWTRQLGLLGES